MRYTRQIAVPGIGESGQARIRMIEARVVGVDLAAEICASYLAGAGVGRLIVDPALVSRVQQINSEVEVSADGDAIDVSISPGDPLLEGARAARRVLAAALGSRG